MGGRQVSDVQFTRWLEEELLYLESKRSEPEVDVLGVEYVELLNKYHNARYVELPMLIHIILIDIYSNIWQTSQTLCMDAMRSKDKSRLRQVAHDAWEGVLFLQTELQSCEERLDIGE